MADDYPNQVEIGTQQASAASAAFYVQAQDREIIVDTEYLFGSRGSRASRASAGSATTVAALDSIPARPSYASTGSTASVASVASSPTLTGTMSLPSVASQGSIVALASTASVASVAAGAGASSGSVASVAAEASTVAGAVHVLLRTKQQPVLIKVEGDAAAYVDAYSTAGGSVDRMDRAVIPDWDSRTITAKMPHNTQFPKFVIL